MKALGVLVALGLALPAPALACGGFFCNTQFPVDQSAERIVFAVDEPDGSVTMHVQITYQGESDDFAWVVPVAGEPDLFVSTDSLFAMLDSATRPYFWLQWDPDDDCNLYYPEAYDDVAAGSDTGDTADTGAQNDGVTVVSQQTVGPYDTVVLQAESSTALLAWLQDADYDLPNDLDPVLAPYVAADQYFVALKLTADSDVGDLKPLGLHYAGTAASIPIQLTSIAATPDMRLEVYLLGDDRAVPDNYLHVTINEAAIDWLAGGSNYEEVITLAADEAGGHAFATDFAGPASNFQNVLWAPGRYDLAALRGLTDPVTWLNTVISQGFPGSADMLALLQEFIPMPQAALDAGITPQSFYNCLECYSEYLGGIDFDPEAATDALDTRIVQPLQAADQLFRDHARLTRMTSSLDAIEMTVDPMFTFNGDIAQDVSNVHTATLEIDCGSDGDIYTADRVLVLSDGRRIPLPSEEWFSQNGETYLDYLGDLTSPAAILIEDLSPEGDGEILFDYRDQAAEEARVFGRAASRCGCDSAAVPAASLFGGLWLLGLLGLRRRR